MTDKETFKMEVEMEGRFAIPDDIQPVRANPQILAEEIRKQLVEDWYDDYDPKNELHVKVEVTYG